MMYILFWITHPWVRYPKKNDILNFSYSNKRLISVICHITSRADYSYIHSNMQGKVICI